jgi:hypothetical protein
MAGLANRQVPVDDALGSWVLLGAALAVLSLYGVGVIALGTPPDATDTGAQVVVWLREHRNGACWFV